MERHFDNDLPPVLSRRNFLKKAGSGVAVAGLSSSVATSSFAQQLRVPDPPGKKLGWAIVGLGRLSIYQILPAFAKCEGSKVVAFVTGSREKGEKLAARYGVNPKNIYNYQNYEALRDNPEVDVVYIVLPNGMHAEYTIRAAKAGKHVLTEKPMANTPKDCEEMIKACREANRKLMVAYRCRYEPYNQALIKISREGELGPINTVVSDHGFNIGDPTQWRLKKDMAGGGSLMDIGIYALQAARYTTGEEPVEVNAMEYTDRSDPRFKEVEETINFQLRFPSGALAQCTSSYGYAGQNRIRVIGTKGWAELEPATSYTGLRMRVRKGNAIEERDMGQRDHFALEMDHMSNCVTNNKEPLTPGEEGLRDIRIITAIYESARMGKTIKL
ncbi:MAG TPA: Gfo/Idh/MocA family oxidoreductase [Blastocatellia bacterium]|nr:Gfo/Idh/MocA family oxidoreductase [Blastocatellia bacterium]